MATIPCYRCGHPLDVSFGTGKTPDVCPNCGHHFAAHSPPVSSRRTRDDDDARSELSTRNASAIAILLAVISGVVKPAADRGMEVGKSLGSGFILIALAFLLAVICATLCLAFGKKFRRTLNRSYSLIVIILASILLVGAVAGKVTGRHAGKIQEQKAAAAAMSRDFEALREAGRIAAEKGGPIELNLPPAGDPDSDAGRIQRITRIAFQSFADLRNAYLKSMEETGFNTLLEPDRLAKDKGLKQSREIIAKCKAVVAEHRGKFTEHVRIFPEKLRDMPDSPLANSKEFEDFKKGFHRSQQRSVRMWDLEMDTVNKSGDIIEILAAAEGRWQEDGGSLMFDEDADLEKFNMALNKLMELAAESEKLREEAYSSGKAKLENFAD